MKRHAGFAAVATVSEGMINGTIAAYCRSLLGPFFFPLPTTAGIAPFTVTFSGLMELLAPEVELHPNADNLVTVRFTFRSTLRAQFTGGPMQTNTVQWVATVQLAVFAIPQDDRIVLGIDTSQVVFEPLAVQTLAGPALPDPIRDALQSPKLAAAATAFVHTLPAITIAPPLLSTRVNFTQPLNLPWLIAPEWFAVSLETTRIVTRVSEHAISVGIDMQGFAFEYVRDQLDLKKPTSVPFSTAGDPDALVDLISEPITGSVYFRTYTEEMEFTDRDPMVKRLTKRLGGQIAVTSNLSFLADVVAKQVSPQIAQTPVSVSPGVPVTLEKVALGYSGFQTFAGSRDGLMITFRVGVDKGPGAEVDGRVHLLTYLNEPDGTTAFVSRFGDRWIMQVVKVNIDLPGWLEFATFVLAVLLGVAIPVMAPMFLVAWLVLVDAVLPTLEENIESQAQQSLPAGFLFPRGRVGPLPGLPALSWWSFRQYIKYVSFGPDSIDMALSVHVVQNPREEPLGTILPDKLEIPEEPGPLVLRLKLRDDLERLGGPNLKVRWIVFDADTRKVVAAGDKAYDDPHGNGIILDLHTQELYLVDNFDVRCAATLSLGSQVGDVWTGSKIVPVLDGIDRRHKYVKWAGEVHFRNEGTGDNWWSERRKSRIHRTAIAARCLAIRKLGPVLLHELFDRYWSELMPMTWDWRDWAVINRHRLEALGAGGVMKAWLTYFDNLSFEWSELNQHRVPLCEYCFFGGPNKTIPFPEEDWFKREPSIRYAAP